MDAIRTRYPEAQILTEVASAESLKKRPALRRALAGMRMGDALVVSKLDRLGRSTPDFDAVVRQARGQGWALICMDIGLDTSGMVGEMMAGFLAIIATFERRRNSERVCDALEAARPELEHRRETVLGLRATGLSQRAIAAELGCHRNQVSRILHRVR